MDRGRILPLAELIGRWEIIALRAWCAGSWMKSPLAKPGMFFWTFREDGTVLRQETKAPDMIVSYTYCPETGKLTLDSVWGDFYIFGDGENEADLYCLDFDYTLEKCKSKFRLKRT